MAGIFDTVEIDTDDVKLKKVFNRFNEFSYVAKCLKTGGHQFKKNGVKTTLWTCQFEVVKTDDPAYKAGDTIDYSKSPAQSWGSQEIIELLLAAAGLQPGVKEDDEIIKGIDWKAQIRASGNNEDSLSGRVVNVVGKLSKKGYVNPKFSTTVEGRRARLEKSAAKK